MSCGQIALRELGMTEFVYYASEVDKHAIRQTKLNFPDTIQLGDVTRWRDWHIDWSGIALILAGSPCQGFSFAGKQLAFDDPRSRLFFVFAEILSHVRKCNPNVKFLLENVNMKKDYLRIISEYVGVFPVNINSTLVSAQNRNRLYWTDIRTRFEGLFGDVYSDIPQPKDRRIFLRDILDENVPERYYLPQKTVDRILMKGKRTKSGCDKSGCLTCPGHGSGYHSDMDLICVRMTGRNPDKLSNVVCISSNQKNATISMSKSTPMVSAMGLGGGHVPMIIQLPRGRNRGNVYKSKSPTLTINSFEQNNMVIQLNQSKESGGVQLYQQQNRVYDTEGKSPALMAGMSCGSHAIVCHNMMPRSSKTGNGGTGHLLRTDGKSYCLDTGQTNAVETDTMIYPPRIRRLTPTECARLQTIPEWYKWECSETQQYKMLGNGWTVEVIKHILGFLDQNSRRSS